MIVFRFDLLGCLILFVGDSLLFSACFVLLIPVLGL